MNEKILAESQALMDVYYQDFAPDDAFFRLEDFAIWVGRVYADEADKAAKLIYQTSRSESGVGYITFSQDWWASKVFDVEKKDGEAFVELDIEYVGFEYDTQNSGIQEVVPVKKGGSKGSVIRTSLTESWQLNHIGTSSTVFWWPEDERLIFFNNAGCMPKSVKVFYIPSPDDENFKVPSSKAFIIAQRAWQYMKMAQQGTIIDTTNNANKNISAQTEIDQSTMKPLV